MLGERGVNLSGGQKARVSFARCLYTATAVVDGAPCPLCVLDDPLSAVDVEVANRMWALGVRGLLRQYGVQNATHDTRTRLAHAGVPPSTPLSDAILALERSTNGGSEDVAISTPFVPAQIAAGGALPTLVPGKMGLKLRKAATSDALYTLADAAHVDRMLVAEWLGASARV